MILRYTQKSIGGVLPLSIIQIEIESLPSLIVDKTLLSFMKNTKTRFLFHIMVGNMIQVYSKLF